MSESAPDLPPVRGRPQGDHNTRRKEIAEATWSVISKLGLQGATMRAIARETGYTTGVLSHYFRDKDEMLEFAIDSLFRALEDEIEHLDKMDDARQELRNFLELVLPVNDQARFFWSLWMHFLADTQRSAHRMTIVSNFQANIRKKISEIIDRLIEQGTIAETLKVLHLTDLLHATIDGLSGTWIFDEERFTPDYMRELIDNIITIISPDLN